MTHAKELRKLLVEEKPVLAPGCFDALSALMIEQAGFSCAYLSGANLAFSKLGLPDIGLVGMTEVADTISYIRDRIAIPLVVDGDTGYGNALNVQRTVRLFERMGASAIQLEDQVTPKRCGHLDGKALISSQEMVGKIKAATDARQNGDTIILARTDAIAVEGFECALDRAEAYIDAGADMLFVEAPQSMEQMRNITARFQGRTPLLANMVEGGKTPVKSATVLGDIGFAMVIFPGALNRMYTHVATRFLQSLKEARTTEPWWGRMNDLMGMNDIVGLEGMLALGEQYGSSAKSK